MKFAISALFLFLFLLGVQVQEGGGACVETTKRELDNSDYYGKVIKSIYQPNNSYFVYKSVDPDVYLEEWTVKDTEEPLRYEDRKTFYWDLESVRNTSASKICKYQITEKDLDLKNTYFLNGSQPEHLYYGCSFLDSCKGLECTVSMCKKIFFIMILFSIITFLSVFLHRAYKKREFERELRKHPAPASYRDLAEGVRLVRRVTSNGITVVTWQREEEEE